MVIFVQVYRTIDKVLISYKVLKEQKRAKESTTWSIWREVLLKLSAPEVMTSSKASSSEASHHKQYHQKLKFIRRWETYSFKGWLMDLISSSIAEEWLSVATAVVKEFESIGCLFSQERWQRTIVQTVQPLPPLLCSCLYIKTRITAMPAEMFLQTRNAFEIDSS